jgi:ElaB/YqjD/DUF883 family membrane-anchored ribosome-binding protein
MGFLDEFKKLFWTAKAVNKNAVNRAQEAADEKFDELDDSADSFINGLKETGQVIRRQVQDKTGDAVDRVKDFTDDLGESIRSAAGKPKSYDSASDLFDDSDPEPVSARHTEPEPPRQEAPREPTVERTTTDFLEDTGRKVMETGDELLAKSQDLAERTGKVVLEKGGEALEKAKKVAEEVGGKVLEKGAEVGSRMGEVFGDAAKKAEDKFAQFFEEAQRAAEEETKAKSEPRDFNKEPIKTPKERLQEDSLDSKQDFFSKAERFAQGDHHAFNEKPRVIPSDGTAPEKPSDKPVNPLRGFEDLDGDGNELIDDAILDEDNNKE